MKLLPKEIVMSDPAPPGGLNIGFGNYIPWWRVVAILMPNSAPAIRFMEKAEREGKLISVCAGRKRRSIIITDTDQVVVSMVSTETLMGRLDAKRIEEELRRFVVNN
jgi:regulator of extracellular matrix RemA (YlzA/DUF370 family)